MPHLSPMKWLLALSALWTSQFIIQACTWWDTPTMFHATTDTTKSISMSTWQWLQDGR